MSLVTFVAMQQSRISPDFSHDRRGQRALSEGPCVNTRMHREKIYADWSHMMTRPSDNPPSLIRPGSL